jgi:hypothetical protein
LPAPSMISGTTQAIGNRSLHWVSQSSTHQRLNRWVNWMILWDILTNIKKHVWDTSYLKSCEMTSLCGVYWCRNKGENKDVELVGQRSTTGPEVRMSDSSFLDSAYTPCWSARAGIARATSALESSSRTSAAWV